MKLLKREIDSYTNEELIEFMLYGHHHNIINRRKVLFALLSRAEAKGMKLGYEEGYEAGQKIPFQR